MTYHNRYNSPYYWEPEDTWEHWNKLADSYSRHRSDDEFKEVEQHFFDNYVGFNGRDRDVSTIAGERAKSKARGSIKTIGMVGLCKVPQ